MRAATDKKTSSRDISPSQMIAGISSECAEDELPKDNASATPTNANEDCSMDIESDGSESGDDVNGCISIPGTCLPGVVRWCGTGYAHNPRSAAVPDGHERLIFKTQRVS
jgi:hypothetical protein